MTLELHDVTLTYPDGQSSLTALDRVSLSVQSGELTAVVGPSGSGKSSLLAVAATLQTPDSGRVLLNGVETTELNAAAKATLRRDHIGLVFQQPQLLESLTVLEQLEVMDHLGPRVSRQQRAATRERGLALLERVGLVGMDKRRVPQLSGGQRQRVGLARALVHSPTTLLVDEPTSALDHERGAAVMELLREITVELGLATIVVTHDTDLLLPSDRVVSVVDGRLQDGVNRLEPAL